MALFLLCYTISHYIFLFIKFNSYIRNSNYYYLKQLVTVPKVIDECLHAFSLSTAVL